ncbi:MAG: trigger factor [Clostridiales bacterium]|jgi:trigger factor|nr:trigger factor [Clostridiales bacterium]
MDVKKEAVDKNIVKLEIKLPPEKFEEGMKHSYTKNAKSFKLNGFRPGKVPRNVVEKVFGEQALYEGAINYLIPDAYEEAVKETELVPVSDPEYDIKEIGKGKEFIFTVQVTVKPEVILGEYKGIKIEKVSDVVTEEDVNAELTKEAEKNSVMIAIEDRPVQEKDTVIIDFEGFLDDVAFEGGKSENYTLEIGSGQFIPGFEEQLIGMEPNTDKEITVTFPDDYGEKNLAGKQVVFKIKLHEIKSKKLPVIDDEFAGDVSEFDTLEAYKADIKDKLSVKKRETANRKMRNEAIEKVSENAEAEIPKIMIDKGVEKRITSLENNLKSQGISFEYYCKYTGETKEKMEDELRPGIEEEIKASLVIEAISKAENVQATEEQINSKIEEYAKQYKMEFEKFKELLTPEDITHFTEQAILENTIEFIYENAVKV